MEHTLSTQLVKSHFPSSGLAVEGTITCPLCHSTYAPSRFHTYLLEASSIAMESAFLSMCHFCFRCRRPSCPACWDDIHSICAQCAQETHVPFRIASENTHYSSLTSRPLYEHPLSPSAPIIVQSSSTDIDAIKTRPDRTNSLDIDAIKTYPERSKRPDIDSIKTHPPILHRRPLSRHIILSITLFLFFLIVVVLAVSLISVDGNRFIYTTLHVDIRAQLTSLWYLLLSLFHG